MCVYNIDRCAVDDIRWPPWLAAPTEGHTGVGDVSNCLVVASGWPCLLFPSPLRSECRGQQERGSCATVEEAGRASRSHGGWVLQGEQVCCG